jgi:hypothetical protein
VNVVDSLGYTILDPITGQPIDIGPVPVPSYASDEGAFVLEDDNERKIRDAYKKGTCETRDSRYARIVLTMQQRQQRRVIPVSKVSWLSYTYGVNQD